MGKGGGGESDYGNGWSDCGGRSVMGNVGV